VAQALIDSASTDKVTNLGAGSPNKLLYTFFGGGNPPANTPPVANFTFTTSSLTANFTDSSTDSDGTIASRSWAFGDGTTSTATSPSKTYAAAGTYNVTLTVTDNSGATNTKTRAVTVTAPPVGNVLTNGVAVTGLAATIGNSLNYTMEVPAGATNLKFVTSGGTGDADMYVKFGSAPTDTSYDCRPYRNGNAETCTITTAQAGTYHVRLKAYSNFSGVSLTGSFDEDGGQPGDYDYVYPQGRGSYVAGQTVVLATDGGLYQCRHDSWCNSTASYFAPGTGLFSDLAWTKL
jgi:PKD repeat protein